MDSVRTVERIDNASGARILVWMPRIGIVLHPLLTPLDVVAPVELFRRVPGAELRLLWKDPTPVRSDTHFTITPNTSFADCPPLDVVFVPGGPSALRLLDDRVLVDFVRAQGSQARYVTSACTGALVLGAAGLLEGYRATTHWAFTDLLPRFGATHEAGRVVCDRNRLTSAGVTASLDFGLTILGLLAGTDVARATQLELEYAPEPPFTAGEPEGAGRALTEQVARKLRAVRSRMVTLPEIESVRIR